MGPYPAWAVAGCPASGTVAWWRIINAFLPCFTLRDPEMALARPCHSCPCVGDQAMSGAVSAMPVGTVLGSGQNVGQEWLELISPQSTGRPKEQSRSRQVGSDTAMAVTCTCD
jgi:hypothetical protein